MTGEERRKKREAAVSKTRNQNASRGGGTGAELMRWK